jgi:hypothetical protein
MLTKSSKRFVGLARQIAILVLGYMVIVAAPKVRAQLSTASLNGTIQDNTGALIPDAKIVVVQNQTNFTTDTISGPDGSFKVLSIPVGPYTVRVTKDGFSNYEQTGLVLSVGQIATLPITLTVGSAATQNVIVTAETPSVDSTTPTIQNVVDELTVVDLPLNGRNPATLMYTTPGTTDALLNPTGTNPNSTVSGGGAALPDESAPTTNGVRPGGTYFSLDGADNVDPYSVIGGPFPNPDATREFSVVTGSYGARYVSAPGGAVNIVTKSGTNQIHGSVFEFLRNGAVNAENYFATRPDTLKRNQFGFAAGAPILKDKLFAFGSYQQTLVRSQTLIDSYVGIVTATENMQAGQFKSAITGGIVQLPVSTVAGNLMNYIPPPNYAPPNGAFAYYNSTIPNDTNAPQWVAKVDYALGEHRLFARYFSDHTSTPAEQMEKSSQTASGFNALTAAGFSSGFWDNFALGDTWTSKTASWIVDGRASWLKADTRGGAASSLSALSLTALGSTNVTDGVFPALPTFYSLGGLFTSANSYGDVVRTGWAYSVDVIHPFRKHELSFGGNLQFVSVNNTNYTGQNPAFVFVGLKSLFSVGPLDNNGYADLILGYPYEFLQADGNFSNNNGKLFGVYVEDKYHVSRRMTLTGGLRWDPYFPYVPEAKHIDCWRPGQQSEVFTNAPLGLIYPGDPGCSSGGTSTKYQVWQPRVGLAYQLDEKGNTAVRAGWGMYSTQFAQIALAGFSAPPFVRNFLIVHSPFDLDQSIDSPWTSMGDPNPFAAGFHNASYQPPSDVSFAEATQIGFAPSAIDRNFRSAYVEQWSLSLQHAFTPSDSLELAYIGTQGIHIAQSYDANLPVYNGNASNPGSTRPYGSEGLTQILTLVSNSTSNYNGFNATYRHHGKGGIDWVSAFNWSKCLDDGSQTPSTSGVFGATGIGDNLVANGPYLPGGRYGRCDFDENLTFRNTIVWNTPDLKGQNKVLQAVAGSWIISGLVVADAGQPFSATDSADNSQTGLGLDLADRVPNTPLYVKGKLNYDAFAANAPGTYGDSGRNSLRSPKYVDVDTAIMKTFPLGTERLHLMFRAEAFNLFNHPNFYPPAADYNTPSTFGAITAARDPRILQFSLKLLF